MGACRSLCTTERLWTRRQLLCISANPNSILKYKNNELSIIMSYDSPSDEEENLYETCLHGDFDDVEGILISGASLDILNSPTWDEFVKGFLRMQNWKSKIRNIQLLYIYKCTRQMDSTDHPAVYIMELKCAVKSWCFIATFDEHLFTERLERYLPRFDALAMELYEEVIQLCRVEQTHEIRMPSERAT